MQHHSEASKGGVTLSPPDLRRVTTLFCQPDLQQAERKSLLNQFLQQTIALNNAAGAIYFTRQDEALVAETTLLSRQMQTSGPGLIDILQSCADNAISQEKAGSTSLNDDNSLFSVNCPLPGDGGCLCVLLVTSPEKLSSFLVILQLAAALLDQYLQQSKESAQIAANNSLSIQFLPTLSKIFSLPPGKERLLHFNQSLKTFTGADLCALARGTNRKNIRIVAISDIASQNRQTDQLRLLQKGIDECVLRGRPLAWPKSSDPAVQNSLIAEEICHGFGGSQILLLPLATGSETPRAVAVFLWKKQMDRGHVREALQGFTPVLAGLIPCLDGSGGQGILSKKTGQSHSSWSLQNRVTAVVGAVLVLALFLPVPYRITADAVVRPRFTRFIVSRYDGLLKESNVRPGDRVNRGAILARLDGRQTEVELAALQAERDKARKKLDQETARGNTAAAQVARLDMRKIDQQITRLTEQQKHLLITSPVTGMVLTGDLQRAEGSPVNRGQTLFEVAPLAQMEVEVAIPEKNISQVEENALVSVRFKAYQETAWEKHFSRIEPRAQIKNNTNVFIGILEFDNPDGLLRPGMRGTAKIHAGTRLLGWILFRKPWHTLLGLFDTLL